MEKIEYALIFQRQGRKKEVRIPSDLQLARQVFESDFTEWREKMVVAYIRVSTTEQNEQRQIEAMTAFQIERWFIEKVSGKDMCRPKLQEMLEFVREGDTVHIHDFSRLARSTADLLNIVETLNCKGVTLVSNKENIDTSTPTGKLMLTFIGGNRRV